MPIRDGFDPNHPLPFFLSGHADEHEERGSLLLLNASILVLVASLVGIMAILLSLGNPAKVFADIKASLTDISALQPDTVQTTPTAWGAPARDEIATTFATAQQSQAEIRAAPPGALLKQFQDWAAKGDARAQIETVRPAQDARAEIQNLRNPRARVRRDQNARVAVRPVQDARAQNQSVQNAQGPFRYWQSLGWHE
jgi:hypothetical protein